MTRNALWPGFGPAEDGALDRSLESLSQAASLLPQDGEIYRELAAAYFLRPTSLKRKIRRTGPLPFSLRCQDLLLPGKGLPGAEKGGRRPSGLLTAISWIPISLRTTTTWPWPMRRKTRRDPPTGVWILYKLTGDRKTALIQFQKALPYFNDSPQESASIRKEIQDLTPPQKTRHLIKKTPNKSSPSAPFCAHFL